MYVYVIGLSDVSVCGHGGIATVAVVTKFHFFFIFVVRLLYSELVTNKMNEKLHFCMKNIFRCFRGVSYRYLFAQCNHNLLCS